MIDLSRREGESVIAHLERIAARHQLPGGGQTKEPLSSPEAWPRGAPEPDWVREGREEAFAKLRPRRKVKAP
jgi:hypothetical protein